MELRRGACVGGCKITAKEGAAPFWLTTEPAAEFTQTGVWYWNFVYRGEVARGFDGKEDLYLPGVFRAVLQPGESFTLMASTEPPEATRLLLAGSLERERLRQAASLQRAGLQPRFAQEDSASPTTEIAAFAADLVQAADTFIVRTRDRG